MDYNNLLNIDFDFVDDYLNTWNSHELMSVPFDVPVTENVDVTVTHQQKEQDLFNNTSNPTQTFDKCGATSKNPNLKI